MKKRILILILAALLLCAPLSACANNAPSDADGVTVVTSFYPVWLIASAVAKDAAGVTVTNMASQATGCLHDYQLTMNDMKLLESADLFIINGGGLEPFTDDLRDSFPNLPVCEATEGLEMLENWEHTHEDDGEEAHEGHDHGDNNAHLWMSVEGACAMAEKIAGALSEIDAANADAYADGAKAFCEEARAVKAELTAALSEIENRNAAIFSEPFAYLAADYGFTVVGCVALDEGEEPSAKQLNETIDAVKQSGAQLLFTDSQYSDNTAVTVSLETGAKVVTLSALTGYEDGDWCSLMRTNAQAILDALQD